MKKLYCSVAPSDHGGRIVFEEDDAHYCVECNARLVPEEDGD